MIAGFDESGENPKCIDFWCHLGHLTKVFKQSFWMRGFGARTAKRTTLWSNSTGVRFFATSKKAKGAKSSLKLADVYVDKNGRTRYKGNSNLRKSQSHP